MHCGASLSDYIVLAKVIYEHTLRPHLQQQSKRRSPEEAGYRLQQQCERRVSDKRESHSNTAGHTEQREDTFQLKRDRLGSSRQCERCESVPPEESRQQDCLTISPKEDPLFHSHLVSHSR